jgi:hypothetical protein
MRKGNAFDEQTQLLLDHIGGEPLSGSGFENEVSETGFDAADIREEE